MSYGSLGAEISWSSNGGLKASGMPIPTQSVQTTTQLTVAKPTVVMPLYRAPTPAPAPAPVSTSSAAVAAAAMQALQQQKAAAAMQAPQSSQASMLGRYALWGVLGLGAALIIYKLAKK
jgi:uncharacterized protein HemX